MTGRGVDQILPHPSGHRIFEPYVQDARDYVTLAEARNGPIARPVAASYIWGEALSELARVGPHVRIINLETSVTASDDYWRGKGINYRMHPKNVGCLTAAGIDVCGLANNHVLDYGYRGLTDTLDTLTRAGLQFTGAGCTLAAAQTPAIVSLANGTRVFVFGVGSDTSGIPPDWAARDDTPGIDFLPDFTAATAGQLLDRVHRVVLAPRDRVVVSIHWGSNWGYDVPAAHVRFAHWLVEGGVDVVYGHSSHHPRPIEVYRDRLILYGCGDFIDDYEGIEGYEEFRDDLVLMYFATLSAPSGELISLQMTPMQIRRMTLNKASRPDAAWSRDTLDRVSASHGAHVDFSAQDSLSLRWEAATDRQVGAAEEAPK